MWAAKPLAMFGRARLWYSAAAARPSLHHPQHFGHPPLGLLGVDRCDPPSSSQSITSSAHTAVRVSMSIEIEDVSACSGDIYAGVHTIAPSSSQRSPRRVPPGDIYAGVHTIAPGSAKLISVSFSSVAPEPKPVKLFVP